MMRRVFRVFLLALPVAAAADERILDYHSDVLARVIAITSAVVALNIASAPGPMVFAVLAAMVVVILVFAILMKRPHFRRFARAGQDSVSSVLVSRLVARVRSRVRDVDAHQRPGQRHQLFRVRAGLVVRRRRLFRRWRGRWRRLVTGTQYVPRALPV